jgi:anaerobic magnesium-protoporphyrin IX monomethyl ester cyclase
VYLEAGAEAVIHGEGLGAMMALLGRLDADITQTPAAFARDIAEVSVAGVPRAGADAARLPAPPLAPLPAWDLVDVEKYRRVWRRAHGYFSLNMAASRGCSFRCNWCAKPIWGNQYLQRPARETAAEMVHLRRHYRPDHVWFADDIFGFRVDWVNEFAAALAESGGGVPFTIQLRADLVSPRMAAALRAAGCREVWLGAESGSQKILDAMNKGTTVAQNLHARALLGAEGIRVGFFLQLGYLGEELPDILATRRLLRDARPDDVGVSVSYPLPGTRFHEQVRQQLRGKTRWLESNDLEMMFAGTYQSDFYRALRDLLHEEVTHPGSTELERRWNELLSREAEFRSDAPLSGCPAPGPDAGSMPALALGGATP